jgi:hypothetical protein
LIAIPLTLTCFLAACAPGALIVPPKLGISRVDKDASEIEIHAAQAELSDETAEVLVSEVTEQMTEGIESSRRGTPARFRMRIKHDWHVNGGWFLLAVVPGINLIGIPILLIAQPDTFTCDDSAVVDLQIQQRIYTRKVVVTDKGAPWGNDQWRYCTHHVMQAALDSIAADRAAMGAGR